MKSTAGAALGTIALALAVAALWTQADLFIPAKTALTVFLITAALWMFTRINAAWVALVAVLVLAMTGATSEDRVFAMLGLDIIWLMIGAFTIGAAVEHSGLAARLASHVSRRARSVRQLFWLTTALLIPFTFLIPSTSGRAATLLPLLKLVPDDAGAGLRRAYCLLIPVVILLATSAALTGAGSHLVLDELVLQRLGDRFGFGAWALWGLPFAMASSALACWTIMRLFLSAEQRDRRLGTADTSLPGSLSGAEWRTIAIAVATLALWFTSAWHDLGIALVAILAMLALTAPGVGVIGFKQGLKAVNWPLIVFVGAAMLLGRTLIDTQAASWVMDGAFTASGLDPAAPQRPAEWAIVAGVAGIAMVSHLVVTSHVARAAALGPPLLLFAQTAGVEPLAVLFIGAVGINYCITLPVCSKALMVFHDAEGDHGFTSADLARLSLVMALPNLLLIVIFYFMWWKWTGLSLL